MFGFIRNELLEVIEWKEQGKDTVLWKFPDKDSSIKYGAQLIVREAQAAIFLNEGQIADVYYPGRYELKTENMPVLTKKFELFVLSFTDVGQSLTHYYPRRPPLRKLPFSLRQLH